MGLPLITCLTDSSSFYMFTQQIVWAVDWLKQPHLIGWSSLTWLLQPITWVRLMRRWVRLHTCSALSNQCTQVKAAVTTHSADLQHGCRTYQHCNKLLYGRHTSVVNDWMFNFVIFVISLLLHAYERWSNSFSDGVYNPIENKHIHIQQNKNGMSGIVEMSPGPGLRWGACPLWSLTLRTSSETLVRVLCYRGCRPAALLKRLRRRNWDRRRGNGRKRNEVRLRKQDLFNHKNIYFIVFILYYYRLFIKWEFCT